MTQLDMTADSMMMPDDAVNVKCSNSNANGEVKWD
jgi:hypothetical protein